jgi:hypothetical protein
MTPGKLSYVQIPALDAEVSAAFYAACFGWEIRGTPEHRSFSDASGDLIGAWITDRAIAREPGILAYISVGNVDSALARIRGEGGAVVLEPYAEGDLRVATFQDPAGNVLGIWQGPGEG